MRKILQFALVMMTAFPAWATQYYLNPAGSNTYDGTEPTHTTGSTGPWLTPTGNRTTIHCGDVLTAATGTYPEDNFNHTFPAVTGSGHCFAILKCATFDACYVTASDGGAQVWVSVSHWWVQGFEADDPNVASTNSCFKASPLSAATITDIAFIDDVANSCPLGGFVTAPYYKGGQYSVDYFTLIADIAYNAAQSSGSCASGVSIYKPVNYDTAPGTHIFIDQVFTWGNVNPDMCAGIAATDGEGIILDDFDGDQSPAFPTPYTGQTVVENVISIWNGSAGIEAFKNTAAPLYILHSTAYANSYSNARNYQYCGEMLASNSAHVQFTGNIMRTIASTGCNANKLYAFYGGHTDNITIPDANAVYSAAGNNYYCDHCASFTFGPKNVTGTDPAFSNPPTSAPAAPSCDGSKSVITCMATLVADMKPTAAGMSGYGYQSPSTTAVHDPLWPQWLNQYSSLLTGLVTQGK